MNTRLVLAFAIALAAPQPLLAQDSEESVAERFERSRLDVTPYIEASQVVTAQLEPGDDVVTYTRLAAGVDAGVGGRNVQGSVSLRYERRIGWGDAGDGDTISGIARASAAILPRVLTLEAGALASRTRIEGSGASSLGAFGADDDATSQFYAIYAGPSLATRAGPVEVTGGYRIGYARVEAPDSVVLTPGGQTADVFDESVSHNAQVRAGIAPGRVAPVGVGVGAGWNRQEISNLDQRVDNKYVRADVTVPVSPKLALMGGVGYEDVEVSSRDVLRDGDGNPVLGPDGRFETDDSQPRRIAYETDGLIWDVGVMWRPSRRTSLSATVGRRYGSTTYYGNLSYQPDARSSLNVSVYDNLTALGGQLTSSLSGLGTDFIALRNPVTGDLGGCVITTETGENCTLAQLGSLRSSVYRSRGVAANYGRSVGRTSLGLGLGYDRRRFIAADDTVLANLDGVIEENIWASAYATRRLDRASSLQLAGYATWFESGLDSTGDGFGYSTSLSYYRNFFGGLSGTAAVGIDGYSREELPDTTNASALVGLRYSF